MSEFTRLGFTESEAFKSPDLTPRKYEPRRFSGKSDQPSPKPRQYVFTPFDPHADEDAGKIALTLSQAEERAAAIVADAAQEAEALRAQAAAIKAEAEAIRASAKAEGREEGLREGLDRGRSDGYAAFQKDVAPVLAWLEKIQNLYRDLWTANEPTLVKLAVKVAERIVLKELTVPGPMITEAFRAALDHLQQQHQAQFRVHPDDLAHLESLKGEAREKLSSLVQLRFESDDNLARGDLILETESGRLDATVKRRIEALTEAIDEALTEKFDLDW